MTAASRVPLVAAACVAAACALAYAAHPLYAASVGAMVAVPGGLLALVSAERARRVLWLTVALTGCAAAVRAMLPPASLDIAASLDTPRDALAAPIRALIPEPDAGIVLGIVLGLRASIPRDLVDAFAITGTAHLLAISGSNMTLVATAVALGLRRRSRPLFVAASTAICVIAYSVLVGLGPSVGRAALMACVTSLGLALGRAAAAANGLGAAVTLMLLADPRAIADVGLQLSVAATAGLIAWQRPLSERLAGLPRPLSEGLAATLSASIPTIPIVAATFGRVSLISPVANLLAVPLFAPVMLFGAATALIGAVAPAWAWPFAMAAYVSALALRLVVQVGASVPGAAISVPTGALTAVVATLAVALAGLAISRIDLSHVRLPRIAFGPPTRATLTGACVAGAIAAGIASATAAAVVAHAPSFRLRALDIGQGDAFLIESDGHYALIDGGPDPNLLLRRLGETLPPWERHLDLVVLTHEHVDHGAGLLGVIDRYSIGLAMEPAGMGDVPLVRLWSTKLEAAHVPRRAVRAGAVVTLGRTTIRVLAPDEHRVDFPSLVLRVSTPASSALLMGDATDPAIADVLLDPLALRSRVYVPPHHGAATSYAEALVEAVRPEAAVISVGMNNKYGHPTPITLSALRRVPVYRTDLCGTVEIDLDERPLVARAAKAGVPPDRGGSVPCAPAPG